MDLHVSLDGRRDLAGQIYVQIRAAILDGRLRPGQSLPSSRDLATRLAVSRNTVNAAYDRLVAEGFVTARPGVGTMVSEHIAVPVPDDHGGPNDLKPPDGPRPPHEPGVTLWPRPIWAAHSDPPDLSANEPEFDFRTGMPDARHFPYPTWRALLARQLRPSATRLGVYADPAGHPGLRAAIARHIGVSRAVPTSADRVLVTNGTQQALDLVSRVLLAPGDVVAMEDPGYPPAWRVFHSAGANVVDVPVDADGLVVDALPSRARLVYVSPSHQFPVGMRMSLSRRLSLLSWAQASGAVIVEDDYDSEFRYTGRPIEPLRALDRTGRVVYIGSFSKTMLPTLRLGFCVPPASLFPALRRAKYVLDWHTALPMQAALAEFIDRGLLARHIRRMRGLYQARRDLITTCLDRDFADRLTIVSSLAGLHVTAWLRSGTTRSGTALAGTTRSGTALSGSAEESRDVVRRAADAGVAVQALADFSRSGVPPAGLMIGYGLIPLDRIEEGLRRLRGCIAS